MKKETRDNVIYLTIAVAVVAILGSIAWYQSAHGMRIHMPGSNAQFATLLMIVGVFGYAIKEWRKAWRSVRFWATLGLLLIVYLPLQILLFRYVVVNIITLPIVGALELFLLLFLLERIFSRQHHHLK